MHVQLWFLAAIGACKTGRVCSIYFEVLFWVQGLRNVAGTILQGVRKSRLVECLTEQKCFQGFVMSVVISMGRCYGNSVSVIRTQCISTMC